MRSLRISNTSNFISGKLGPLFYDKKFKHHPYDAKSSSNVTACICESVCVGKLHGFDSRIRRAKFVNKLLVFYLLFSAPLQLLRLQLTEKLLMGMNTPRVIRTSSLPTCWAGQVWSTNAQSTCSHFDFQRT